MAAALLAALTSCGAHTPSAAEVTASASASLAADPGIREAYLDGPLPTCKLSTLILAASLAVSQDSDDDNGQLMFVLGQDQQYMQYLCPNQLQTLQKAQALLVAARQGTASCPVSEFADKPKFDQSIMTCEQAANELPQ